MKKTILFLAILSALCSSCLSSITENLVGGSMSCKINNADWNSKEATAINILGSLSITAMSGDDQNSSTVLLTIDKANAKAGKKIDLGKENLNLGSALTSYSSNVNGVQAMYTVTSGMINITAVNGSKIEGTFSFKGFDITGKNKEVSIENGKFSVNTLL
jgi:Family of unknown function (DUF6252)